MSLTRRLRPISGSLGLVLVTLLAACSDTATTEPNIPSASQVFEARFGGGNPDFFFASPLAKNPAPGDAGFEAGAEHPDLRPYVRVCTTNGAAGVAGCLDDVTLEVTGSATGLLMTFNQGTGLYGVSWDTDELKKNLKYRIEIWGAALTEAEREDLEGVTFPGQPLRPRWLFGWRDIQQSPSIAACQGDEEFCSMNFGQLLPVKVRIEEFVFCPVDKNCALQFVAEGADANLKATLGGNASAQLFIPGQQGTNVPVGFEPCTAAEKATVQAFSGLPTFGPCLKTATPGTSPIELTEPVRISYCDLALDIDAIRAQLAVPEQDDLIGVHHFSTNGVPNGGIVSMEAWPHAEPTCGEPTSGEIAQTESDGPLVRLAETGRRLLGILGPQPLVALDRGGGGEGWELESFYMLALAGKLQYESPGDDYRIASRGEVVTLRAKVTDVNGDPILGAKVGWIVSSSPANGASVAPALALTGADGISQVAATLSSSAGNNVFHAKGRGLADARETGCTLFGGTAGAASCNGPRGTVLVPIFDPFQPLLTALDDGDLLIPDGTRLPFTVCTPGRTGGGCPTDPIR